MEIDNNKKTKASETLDSDAPDNKKARVESAEVVLVDEKDPLFKITKEELKESMDKWFDACDPALRQQSFGWGFCPMVANELHARRSVKESLSMYDDYYKNSKFAHYLESDKALCEGICPLHVFHIAAYEWNDRPDCTYGSYEQQVLFYVMKHNFQAQKDKLPDMGKFVVRLLDLSYQLFNPHDWVLTRDDSGKPIRQKQPTTPHISKIEPHQQAAIGVFFYPNLQFLFKRKDEERYSLSCIEFKRGIESFCEVFQQLNENIRYNGSLRFEWPNKLGAQKALDYALEKFHHALIFLEDEKSSHLHNPKLHDKPVSLYEYVSYNVIF